MSHKRTAMVLGSSGGSRRTIDITTRKHRTKKNRSWRDPELLAGLMIGFASSFVADAAYDKYNRDKDESKINFILVHHEHIKKFPYVLVASEDKSPFFKKSFHKKSDAIDAYKQISKRFKKEGYSVSKLEEVIY